MKYCNGVGKKGLVDCDPENGQCEICYMADLEEENKKLKADNESLRADAWRYRWLRDSDYAGKILRDMGAKYRADADQRIDAAMAQGEQS